MRNATCLTVMALLGVAVSGCEPKVNDEWADLVRPEALRQLNLQYYWSLQLPLDKGERLDRLYLVGEKLYALTNRNRLISMDAASGGGQWSQSLAGTRQRVFAPVHADSAPLPRWIGDGAKDRPTQEMIAQAKPFDAVIVNTLSRIIVLNRATGDLVSKIPLDFPANTGGAADGICYYLASAKGWFYAMDMQKALMIWNRSTDGMVSATPRLFKGVLYVAGEDKTLYAVETGATPSPLWNSGEFESVQMHGPVTADIHVDSRGVFVPCEDNRLYAYDRLTGKGLWEPFVCQGSLRDPVQVGEATIFQFATRDRFYAIDANSGAQRWAMPGGRKVLGVFNGDGGMVCLLDQMGNMRMVDEISGTVKGAITMIGYDLFVPNAVVPAVYVATKTGRVVCIRPENAGMLTPESIKASLSH
jgi:outer membrane protein assembly factor BamB